MSYPEPIMVVFLSPHSDPEADLGEPDAGGQCVYEHALAKSLAQIDGVTVRTYCRQTGKRASVSKYGDYSVHRLETGKKGFVPKEQIESHIDEFAKQVVKQLSNSKNIVLHGH